MSISSEIEIRVLDHGYIRFVESWGSDERIIESARMSTNKGFQGWGIHCKICGYNKDRYNLAPVWCGEIDRDHQWVTGDEKLLRYLYEHKHATPFEMAGMTIEVQAPIFVFREWHRHRTQCLAPHTLIHFNAPKSRPNRHSVHKMSIEDIWRKWQPTVRNSRPERQTNPFFPRSRIQAMQLRGIDESLLEMQTTRIVDVIKGDPKPMVRIVTASGKELCATLEHKVFTDQGWLAIRGALRTGAKLAVEGTSRSCEIGWEIPPIDESMENWKPIRGWEDWYEVSDMGRVRRLGCLPKKNTVAKTGYLVVSLNRPGVQVLRTVHSLVLESFVGRRIEDQEARHRDSNRQNARLDNLCYGTSKQNSEDTVKSDRHKRLTVNFEEIVEWEEIGVYPSYDLTVLGPYHNFIADGFVVHNSYNEMSARYTQMPNLHYVPSVDRILSATKTSTNKQESGLGQEISLEMAEKIREVLAAEQVSIYARYEWLLSLGLSKELARVNTPVSRYSRMRASANLRNWLAFLTLRMDLAAQREIRQYANAVGGFIAELFPRTWELFAGEVEA